MNVYFPKVKQNVIVRARNNLSPFFKASLLISL